MRILTVDDDVVMSNFLKTGFEEESFAVDVVHTGSSASYMARTNEYDAIVLDLNLPDKLGSAVCDEIRTTGKSTPIIIVSATTDTSSKVRLINNGADDYLTKPFAFHELLARVRALLRRPPYLMPDKITVGDLELDIGRQNVTRSGIQIYLTRKEFSLLEFLMRHQGSVVSRGMIIEHVWDGESDPFSNTIEAHILNLRKKVDTGFSQKLIHTFSGRGYKIEAYTHRTTS